MTTNSPARVTFYTRRGCKLCDEIWPLVQGLCNQFQLSLASVDVDNDAELVAKHGNWVPVVAIDGRVRARGIIQPAHLKRELRAAAKRGAPERKRMRVGVAIIFDEAGRMLVNQRPEGSYYGGWWEWPGGKCELGESPLAAAQRELKEEIGIEAEDWQLVTRQTSEYPGRLVRLSFFRAQLNFGSLPNPDALEHQWLPPAEVLNLRFLEANLKVLRTLIP